MVETIGIPRALVYFYFYPQWRTFFEELGYKVVLSNKTSRRIVDLGIKVTLNDACIPIKLFHGHVINLIEKKVDAIFSPRIVSVDSNATLCPKFLGLPDMCRYSIDDLPLWIDERIDNRRKGYREQEFYVNIGKKLGKSKAEVMPAYQKAVKAQEDFRRMIVDAGMPALDAIDVFDNKGDPDEAILKYKDKLKQAEDNNGGPRRLNYAIIGYVYLVYDDFVNANFLKKMEELNITPHTFDMLPEQSIDNQTEKLPRNLFWMFSNRVVKAAYHYMDLEKLDGIIHLSAFGCGPDAMTTKIIEIHAKSHAHIPYTRILLDEHTGEAGLVTRLESFTDMIRRKEAMGK
jgi:predicted nucleotide-binding protein (sugar kinase/HSP70/actin superfamily)